MICLESYGLAVASELIAEYQTGEVVAIGAIVIVGWNPKDKRFEAIFESDIALSREGVTVPNYKNIKVMITPDVLKGSPNFYIYFSESSPYNQRWMSVQLGEHDQRLNYICVDPL